MKHDENSEHEEKTGVIAVIDDDPSTRNYVSTLAVHSLKASVQTFSNGHDALIYIGQSMGNESLAKVDAILCDIRMPRMSGHDFLLELHSAGHAIPVVFLSGYLDEDTLTDALRLGAFDAMAKPVDQRAMVSTMTIAMTIGRRQRALQAELDSIKQRLVQEEMTPQLAFDLRRTIEHIEEERKTIALLSLRNHSLKSA